MRNQLVKASAKLELPTIIDETSSVLMQLTNSLGVPREVLASDDEITHAWQELPRLLNRIPKPMLSVLHVRMCVAVATGLFDSAVNYAWNSAVMALRDKVRAFGIHVVPQVIGKNFDEEKLQDLKDSELLELCLSLNLITEEGHLFLQQARDVRNNFSAAHPPVGTLDDQEFLTFLHRCAKYALTDTHNPKGVDLPAFLSALKAAKFKENQRAEWINRLVETHEAQRNLLVTTLHGIYCDPSSTEETRLNALSVCRHFAPQFPPKLKSDLINQHSEYIASGNEERHEASRQFFAKIAMLALLSASERHTLVSRTCEQLRSAHDGWDNFYNEPPFARSLFELTEQMAIPDTTQAEFVYSVTLCATGRHCGVSRVAMPHYRSMISNFSPREVHLLLEIPQSKTILAERVRSYSQCRDRFKEIIALIDPETVPTRDQKLFKKWTEE